MVELGGQMTLIWGEAEGTSNTMLYNGKESSVINRCNAMSRYNSYKLISENIVIK